MFCFFFRSFSYRSYRSKVTTKDVNSIIGIGYGITIIKGSKVGTLEVRVFIEISNLFFTDIDFYKPKVIQGLDLNFNLYLLGI